MINLSFDRLKAFDSSENIWFFKFYFLTLFLSIRPFRIFRHGSLIWYHYYIQLIYETDVTSDRKDILIIRFFFPISLSPLQFQENQERYESLIFEYDWFFETFSSREEVRSEKVRSQIMTFFHIQSR